MWKLLEAWDSQGWQAHLHHLRVLYRKKAEKMQDAAKQHLTGVASWASEGPHAGMCVHACTLYLYEAQSVHPPRHEQLASVASHQSL